jgi:hypothetical protein
MPVDAFQSLVRILQNAFAQLDKNRDFHDAEWKTKTRKVSRFRKTQQVGDVDVDILQPSPQSMLCACYVVEYSILNRSCFS